MDLWALTFEALPKCLVYMAAMVTVGAPVARGLLLARIALALPADVRARIEIGLGRVAITAATILVASLVARAWGHTAASFGPLEAFTWSSLSIIAFESEWGQMWQFQAAGAMTLAVIARGIPRAPSLAWPLTGLAAIAFCYLVPLLGHAAGEPGRLALHGSHVLGGGLWVGTLCATALAAPRGERAAMLRVFAPLAAAAVAALLTTGALAAWIYVGAWSAFLDSWYGRLLVLKVVLVAAVGGFGLINWRQFHRRHPDAAGASSDPAAWNGSETAPVRPAPFRHGPVLTELFVAALVVIVTAVLTELEHP